jgi:hypothetical protein
VGLFTTDAWEIVYHGVVSFLLGALIGWHSFGASLEVTGGDDHGHSSSGQFEVTTNIAFLLVASLPWLHCFAW